MEVGIEVNNQLSKLFVGVNARHVPDQQFAHIQYALRVCPDHQVVGESLVQLGTIPSLQLVAEP